MNSYSKLEFECPLCKTKLEAKGGRFECNHKGTPNAKKLWNDPDKYELHQVHVRLVTYSEAKK